MDGAHVTRTNYVAWRHITEWSQQSSDTNPIFEVTVALGGDPAGVFPNGWAGTLPAPTNGATSREWAYTNYEHIHPFLEYYLNTNWYATTNAVTNWATNVVYVGTPPSAVTTIWNVVTEVTDTLTNVMKEASLAIRDVWLDDCWRAYCERAAVLEPYVQFGSNVVGPYTYRFLDPDDDVADRDYGSVNIGTREGLVWLKFYTSQLIPRYLDWRQEADYVDILETNGTLPTLTATGVLATIGAPTNYFGHTPWYCIGGKGATRGHIVTSEWVFVTYGTFTVENTCGDISTVIVTTNETLPYTNSFTCTNENILAGFTEEDYGFKWFPQIIDELRWFAVPVTWTNTYPSNNLEVGGVEYPDGYYIETTNNCYDIDFVSNGEYVEAANPPLLYYPEPTWHFFGSRECEEWTCTIQNHCSPPGGVPSTNNTEKSEYYGMFKSPSETAVHVYLQRRVWDELDPELTLYGRWEGSDVNTNYDFPGLLVDGTCNAEFFACPSGVAECTPIYGDIAGDLSDFASSLFTTNILHYDATPTLVDTNAAWLYDGRTSYWWLASILLNPPQVASMSWLDEILNVSASCYDSDNCSYSITIGPNTYYYSCFVSASLTFSHTWKISRYSERVFREKATVAKYENTFSF